MRLPCLIKKRYSCHKEERGFWWLPCTDICFYYKPIYFPFRKKAFRTLLVIVGKKVVERFT